MWGPLLQKRGDALGRIRALAGAMKHHVFARLPSLEVRLGKLRVKQPQRRRDGDRCRVLGQLPCERERRRQEFVVRHRDRVGVLAAIFDCLKRAGVNVQETENVVFEGAHAAVARIHVDHAPSDADLAAVQASSEHVLDASIVALG